jgi:hypothetical protein
MREWDPVATLRDKTRAFCCTQMRTCGGYAHLDQATRRVLSGAEPPLWLLVGGVTGLGGCRCNPRQNI